MADDKNNIGLEEETCRSGYCKNKTGESFNDTPLVGVSLKDLAKPSKINGLQAASKVLLS